MDLLTVYKKTITDENIKLFSDLAYNVDVNFIKNILSPSLMEIYTSLKYIQCIYVDINIATDEMRKLIGTHINEYVLKWNAIVRNIKNDFNDESLTSTGVGGYDLENQEGNFNYIKNSIKDIDKIFNNISKTHLMNMFNELYDLIVENMGVIVYGN